MPSYQLHVSHLGQKKGVALQQGKSIKIKATDNSVYQIIDSNGRLVSIDKIAQIKEINQDLWVFLEKGATTPDLILEDYLSFHHVENITLLNSANVTFATVNEAALAYTPVTATEIVTTTSSSVFGGISLFTVGAVAATAAVVGVAVAAASGGGGKGGNEPAPEKSSEEILSEKSSSEESSSEESSSEEISSEEISSEESSSEESSSEESSSEESSSEESSSEESSSEESSSEESSSEESSSEESSSEESSSEESSSEENSSEEHIDDIQIEIISIAGVDNFINVTEAKSQYTQIKGKISGADASADSLVNIILNDGSPIPATVFNDLTFTAQIETSKLLANQGYQLQAVVSGLNNAKNETTATYTVAADAIAKVDIIDIDSNFTAYDNLNSITRLTGNVTFTGVFAQGMNTRLLSEFQVIIGEKNYTAVLYGDHTTFELNIPTSELTLLNGQSISFDFGGKQKASLPNARTSGILSFGSESAYDVTYSSLTLNSDYIAVNEDGSYSVQIPESLALVSGTVSGVAKAGDSVEIVLNDTLYSTQVQLDNSFHISVPAEQLANNNEKVLTATLITKDLAGNEIRVNDVESYLTATEISSDYVQSTQERIVHSQRKYNHLAQENEDEYNYPYFMDMLRAGNVGFNVDVPMNGEGKVIYYHIVSSDIAEEKIATLWRSSLYDNSKGEWSDFSEKHQTMLHEIFEKLSSYLNVKFEYSDSFIEDSSGINIFKGPYHSDTSSGVSSSNHAFSLLSTNENSPAANALWTNDDWFYYVAIHEILHGFDFGHTSDYFTDENAYGGMGAGSLEDSTLFSYQSYNYNTIVGKYPRSGDPNYRYLYEVNTGLHIAGYDLAALHYRYGVNPNARSGDDVYTFQRYQKTDDFGGVYIWDGGGVDTFDSSNENESVYINLKPGSWIYRGEQDTVLTIKSQITYDAVEWFANMGYTNRIAGENSTRILTEYAEAQAFIGYGTQIENAIGSDYNDIIIGNEADNNLLGGKGDDILKGGKGNDYLDGGEGADEMHGGEGDDTFVVDNANDKVIENADEGTDTVLSFVDYTLGENVENLTLMGTSAMQATGNALDNIITANNVGATLDGKAGDDRLIGGLGEDTLIGGEGNDIFVFQTTLNGNVDIIRDFSTGDKIELSKAIFTAIDSVENIMNYIQFEEGKLSYQESSAVDAIHFATLENVASLDQSYFVLA